MENAKEKFKLSVRAKVMFRQIVGISVHEPIDKKISIESTEPLTATEQKLIELLKQNTGAHMLDSGGAYGRNWEQNQDRNFDKEVSHTVNVCGESDFYISFSIYHYLKAFLDTTMEGQKYQKLLEPFLDREDSRSYLQDIEDFITEHELIQVMGVNTYNYDNTLSQVLQYTIFTAEEYNAHPDPLYADKTFIILQIHNGCDVRGGYTRPQIFEISEIEYFIMAQHDISAYCEKCGMVWDSDDSGYHWYHQYTNNPNEKLDVGSEPNTEFKVSCNEENNEVYHGKCKGQIVFHVMDSY